MNNLISYRLDDGVATLTLSNGKVNAISLEVLDAFNKAFDRALEDKAVVIITGQPGMLSGGYDLKVMTSSPESALGLVTAGSTFARRMLSHPYPVVVACPGHAVAKGAFILLSADYRIGADGPYQIGLNEVAIGMTMHDVGIALARGRLHKSALERSVISAEMFEPAAAVDAGFLDKVVQADQLMTTAKAVADRLKQLNMVAFRHTKLKVRKALLEELDRGIQADKSHILLGTEFR